MIIDSNPVIIFVKNLLPAYRFALSANAKKNSTIKLTILIQIPENLDTDTKVVSNNFTLNFYPQNSEISEK